MIKWFNSWFSKPKHRINRIDWHIYHAYNSNCEHCRLLEAAEEGHGHKDCEEHNLNPTFKVPTSSSPIMPGSFMTLKSGENFKPIIHISKVSKKQEDNIRKAQASPSKELPELQFGYPIEQVNFADNSTPTADPSPSADFGGGDSGGGGASSDW